jgi:hypothetical protein
MTASSSGFFSDLNSSLHLERAKQTEILYELQLHVEDETRELVESGVPRDEAQAHVLRALGSSEEIAGHFYEVHSRGSWYHTALAVFPHLLLSLMFVFHLWTSPVWLVPMMVVALAISVMGWRMGRPRWTYPWLGYCLVIPVVSWGLAMSAVGYGAWAVVSRGDLPLGLPIYGVSFVYIGFSLWLVIRFVSKVARPDWVMASLAVLPIPFLAYWFFYFYNAESGRQPLHEVDSSATVVFLILAAATAVFFRVGRRLVRVALLAITAPSMVVLAWLSYQEGPGYVAVFLFSAVSLALLLSPALFDIRRRRMERALRELEQHGRPTAS